jgi:hypothetical protein
MSGGLTPRGQAKLSKLQEVQRSAQTIFALTEQFAAAKAHEDQFSQQLKRRYNRLKLALMGAGFDQLSQLAGAMEVAAGRGGSQRTKARILREGVASIKFQLDMEEHQIRQGESVQKADEGSEEKD